MTLSLVSSSVEDDSDTKRLSREEKGRSSCGRNFWVSGLSSTTRATDLKNLFSRYGKVSCHCLKSEQGEPHCTNLCPGALVSLARGSSVQSVWCWL